jgi:boron transporter
VAQFAADQSGGYLSIAIPLLVLIIGMSFQVVCRSRPFRLAVRIFLTDYGTIMTIVFFTRFPHFGGELSITQLLNLPTSPAFETTTGRGWLVNFWTLGVGNIFLAIPFAVLLTVLFYMDHNISVRPFPNGLTQSLICQGSEFPLKKPASFRTFFSCFTDVRLGFLPSRPRDWHRRSVGGSLP